MERGVNKLRERFGQNLRGVISYTSSGKVEIHDAREGLMQERADVIRENWSQEILAETFSRAAQEENFDLGSLICTTRHFEEATVLNFIFDDKGVVVSFEPDVVEIDGQFLSWCQDQLTVSDS